ncbi:MAG: GNAT family N-acetyltransferase [Magnetococcus sp. YQC-9]
MLAIELLTRLHDRKRFDCGSTLLNRYLQTQATQDMRRRLANCFVAIQDGTTIVGYYTLSASAVLMQDLSEAQTRGLPGYPLVPAALIGRLAVAQSFQREGVGGVLLVDALQRARTSAPSVRLLMVDAKDENAVLFYRHFGFTRLTSRPMTLFFAL